MNEYDCPNCAGTGAVPCEPRSVTFEDPESGLETVTFTVGMCPYCLGCGKLVDCPDCEGTGRYKINCRPPHPPMELVCPSCMATGKAPKRLPETHENEETIQ